LLVVMPCLRSHVRNYYYWALVLLVLQAISSLYCPLPLLNVNGQFNIDVTSHIRLGNDLHWC